MFVGVCFLKPRFKLALTVARITAQTFDVIHCTRYNLDIKVRPRHGSPHNSDKV